MASTTRNAGADMARPGAASNSKMAAKVADRIVEDVMAMGWPVGEVLGSEPELLERYGVSRAVFREAVRLVEHQQVARGRRGPRGGLVITEPTVDAVIDAVVVYLHRVDAQLDEVFEARIVLEEIGSGLAAERASESELDALRAYVDGDPNLAVDPRGLHTLVASISGNPALELFVEVLNRAALLYSQDWRSLGGGVAEQTSHAHAKIAESIIAGDAGLTRHRMRKHLDAEASYLRRRRSTRQMLPENAMFNEAINGKRAETVARRITQTVVTNGIQPGDLIGTETALIEREQVSRAVFREAVRLLEHQHVARMRRGTGGGLYVVAPSVSPITDVAAIYLARRGMNLRDLGELRTGVEVEIVGLAATRIDPAGVDRMRDALKREETSSEEERAEVVHDLHAAIAGTAQNRVLELVALVLIRLSRLHQIEKLPAKAIKQIRAEVHRAHEDIASAVESGDRDIARHRMRRHLDALSASMQ